MADTVEICRTAWEWSKAADDPAFDDLVETYRDGLMARAEVVIADRIASNADDLFGRFERNVLEILVPERFHAPTAKEELKEEVVEEAKAKKPRKKSPVKAPEKKQRPVKVIKKKEVKATKKGAKKR